jgi:hypothetical protein
LVLVENPGLPIKTYRDFEHPTARDKIVDPLRTLFEAMSKIAPHEIFAAQIITLPVADADWKPKGEAKAAEIIEGPKAAHKPFNILRALFEMFKSAEGHAAPKESKTFANLSDVEKERVNRVLNKVGKVGYASKVRLLYLAPKEKFDKPKAALFIGAFKTFSSANTNGFKPNGDVSPKLDYKLSESLEKPYIDYVVTKRKAAIFKNFKGRSPGGGAKPYVLNIEELATIYHLPLVGEAQAIDERIIQEVINDSPIFQLISSKKKIFHHDGGDVNSIVNE